MVGKRLYGRFYVDGPPPWTSDEQAAVLPGSIQARVLEYPLATEHHPKGRSRAVVIPAQKLAPYVSEAKVDGAEMADRYWAAFRQFELGAAPGVLRFATVVSDGPKSPDMWTVVVGSESEREMRVELSATIPPEMAWKYRDQSKLRALMSRRTRMPVGVDSSYSVVQYDQGSRKPDIQTMIEVEGAEWFLAHGGVADDVASTGRIVLGGDGQLAMTYPWLINRATDVTNDSRFDLANLVRVGFPDERNADHNDYPLI